MNKDESLKCFELSRARYSEGDLEGALRMAIKAQRMCESSEISEWLEKIKAFMSKKSEEGSTNTTANTDNTSNTTNTTNTANTSTESSFSSTTEASNTTNTTNNTSTRQRSSVKVEATSSVAFTSEQAKEVKAFLKRDKNDYYGILGISRMASLDEIKKAYKKLALKFHPDKNQAPGADEAFKLISVAVSTLGDEEKKRNYDRFGVSASSSSMESTTGRSAHFAFNGGNGEISPEDLFNMFFSSAFSGAPGGFNQNPFASAGFDGGSPQFFFSSNFAHSFRPPQTSSRRRRPAASSQQSHEEFIRKIIQFAPLIVIFLLSLLSSWVFGTESDSPSNDHLFSLNPSNRHRFPRMTRTRNVPYYATTNFQRYFEKLKETDRASRLARELDNYESIIEHDLKKSLQKYCKAEEQQLAQKLKRAKAHQIDEIKTKFKLNSCEELKKKFQE